MKRKKIFSIFILSLVFMLIFSSCNKNSEILDPKSPVTIELWHYYSGNNHEAINSASDEFNRTIGIEKGIVVNPVRIPSIAELETAAEAAAKGVVDSEPMPHIFSCYPDVALKIDALGKLVDLREYFSQEELSKYVADFLSDGTFGDDRQLLIPIAKSTELLFINDTDWQAFSKASGYTDQDLETWESICEVSKSYYEWTDQQTPNKHWDGKAMLGFDSVANYIIVSNRQMGLEVIHSNLDGTGKVVLNENIMRKIFDIYFPQNILGYFGSYGEFRADDVKQGDLISYVASSSGASYFPTRVTDGSSLSEVEFKALPYPILEGGEHYAIQQGAGMAIAASDPEHELGAAEFLKWFTAEKQNVDFVMSTGYMPINEGAYTSDIVKSKIDELHYGDESQQIIAKVYDIAFEQILHLNTYSAKPFEYSYDVRTLLQNTLMDITEQSKLEADNFKTQGMSSDEILELVNADTQFKSWLDSIISELEAWDVNYEVISN